MAAYFPCQGQHSYLLDPACSIPNTPAGRLLMQPQQFGEILTTASSSCFPSYMFFSPEASSVATAPAVRAYDNGTIRSSSSGVNNAPSAYEHLPLVVESHDDDIVPKQEGHMQIKRKSRDVETSLIATTESKDIKELGKSKKQKRLRGGTKKEEEKTPKTDDDQKASSKASNLNASDGYVHVRARRGQATDSHSLAERVRREKISDRMKMLQGLVPGCDKVTGKALMLDEIINYVQSLQNQVEFLSMKIASLSPILYDFNVDYFDYINQPQESQKVMRSIPQPLPAGEQGDHLQVNVGTASYQVMAHAAAPLPHVQECTSFPQDGGSGSGTALQVGGPSQGFLGQVEFLNICPFQ